MKGTSLGICFLTRGLKPYLKNELITHILHQLLEVLIPQPLGTHEGHPYRLIVSNQSLSARSEITHYLLLNQRSVFSTANPPPSAV
jgi:hypothetical protein